MDILPFPAGNDQPHRMHMMTPHIYAGFYPGDIDPHEERRKLSWLLDQGITVFINLTEPSECNHGGQKLRSYQPTLDALSLERRTTGIRVLSFPIRDFSAPSRKQMVEILDVIDSCIASNQ